MYSHKEMKVLSIVTVTDKQYKKNTWYLNTKTEVNSS